MVPILVGEQNQLSNDHAYDLYPWPEHSSGGRLCIVILGMKRTEYLKSFERRNLLGRGPWDARAASAAAAEIMAERPGARLVLLGARVCMAFGLRDLADFEITMKPLPGGAHFSALRLPHTSGRCRKWNDPAAYERARAALRSFLPERVAARIGSADRREPAQLVPTEPGLDT